MFNSSNNFLLVDPTLQQILQIWKQLKQIEWTSYIRFRALHETFMYMFYVSKYRY